MLATLASVNSAHRLKDYLSRSGVSSKVIQTPSSLTKEGCGYSIRFEDGFKSVVSRSAKELRVNIRAFYLENTENGITSYIKE